jgi:6-phosphogluconolactonase
MMTVNPEIRIFEGLEPLSLAAAMHLAQQAKVKAVEITPFMVALSGGSTPKPLYELLGSPMFTGLLHWRNVHLFQVDERCVPPDDPQSNYRMIRQALLESAPFPEEDFNRMAAERPEVYTPLKKQYSIVENFHRMAAERPDREQAAREYAEEMARVLLTPPGEWPRLDLVFLGMGADGHTASLFPGSPALDECTAWVVPTFVAKLDSFRLTLTLPVLNAAAHVIFLVAGADKAETLRQVLEGPPGRFPAQLIQPTHGRLSWFLDESAAKMLKRQ